MSRIKKKNVSRAEVERIGLQIVSNGVGAERDFKYNLLPIPAEITGFIINYT